MNYFAGIDIGSTTIKIVLTDEMDNMIAYRITPTGSAFHQNTVNAFNGLLESWNIAQKDVAYVTATGYGRQLFKEADETISEITANAIGARKMGESKGVVKSIINIGGQDTKVILLDDHGNVKNFSMNDRCAAGTGRFLEMVARILEIKVEELGDCHLKAKEVPVSINSTCTVFAESEIISLLAKGHAKEEIVAGIHYSIVKRVSRLAKRISHDDVIFFDGGPAMNKGLVAALEEEMMREVVVPDTPQITTACGAALIGKEAYDAEKVAA